MIHDMTDQERELHRHMGRTSGGMGGSQQRVPSSSRSEDVNRFLAKFREVANRPAADTAADAMVALLNDATKGGYVVWDGMGGLGMSGVELFQSREMRQLMYRLTGRFEVNAKGTWRHLHEAAEVQARWDQRRLERITAPAPAPSRTAGRL